MSTYPKTVYQVAARHITMICQRVILRETANYFFFQDRYQLGREDKVFKDRIKVCDTFEEAKAELVRLKRNNLDRIKLDLEDATAELAKAEGLTAPTHVDDPGALPSGPLTV